MFQLKRTRSARRAVWGLLVAALMAAGALLLPAPALAHGPADGGASADDFQDLFNITLLLAIPIFLLVEGLILFAIFRYRRKRQDDMPEQIEGNWTLEISWTVLSFIIIGVLFVLTLRALQTDYEAEAKTEGEDPDLTVHVDGYLYNWDYTYYRGARSDDTHTHVITTKRMTIPADRDVLLEITSQDVQHSFWVPELAGKVDAIPGYTNTMWLNVDEPGVYEGNCAEYCGLNHYAMLIEVEVLPPAEFDTWLANREAAANPDALIGTEMDTPLPTGDYARGEAVFNELACNTCHLPEQDQPSGPSIMTMEEDAAESAAEAGVSEEYYIREAILLPCAKLAPGWDQCIMPQDYGERLTAQQLADLIEYLLMYGAFSDDGPPSDYEGGAAVNGDGASAAPEAEADTSGDEAASG